MKNLNNSSEGDRPSNNPKQGSILFFCGRAFATRIVITIFLAASVAFALYPHKAKTLHASSKLQTGQKMEVELTVRSPWGWCEPDRISDLQVHLNGLDLPVKREAYFWTGPIDTTRGPAIAESWGFPEVIVWGKKDQSLNMVSWKFLNYYFSERDVMRDHKLEETQYAASGISSSNIVGVTAFQTVNGASLNLGLLKPIALDSLGNVLKTSPDQAKKVAKQTFKESKK